MPARATKRHHQGSAHDDGGMEEPPDQGLLHAIKGSAARLQALHLQAVREYAPVVESILRSRSRDTRHIEHTLDGLLDFCGHEPALLLFKKLCRYYWEIDPAATARQIHAYREFWDAGETKEPGELEGGQP